jgi:hypothetical protein
MRVTTALLLPLLTLATGCQVTRTSPCFSGLGSEAKDFVARSAPEVTWATRLQTEPEGASPARLPGTQILAFETQQSLDPQEVQDLFERLEFEVVRWLFRGHGRLVARHETPAQPGVRGITWEYDAGDRRGFITFFGVRREPGYEVIFNVCEIGGVS